MLISGGNRPFTVIPMLVGTWGITDMGAALSEFASFYRIRADLSGFTQARVVANLNVAGSTNAEVRVQYSTDQVSWNYLDDSAGPAANMSATGPRTSSWVTLASGARADVNLRLISINGDGVADPSFRIVLLELR